MIQTITDEDFRKLSTLKLAARMDEVFTASYLEQYGEYAKKMHLADRHPSVTTILSTPMVKRMNDVERRKVCWLAFNLLLQMEYSHYTLGLENAEIYGKLYSEEHTWKSVRKQIKFSALSQFHIISSRIAMECFMQFIHFLGEKKEIKQSQKSTFHGFKKWLLDSNNPFSYFARHTLRTYIFDRTLRSPEVHAGTKLSCRIVKMAKPSKEDKNNITDITNILLNVWRPLLQILNDEKPTSISGTEEDAQWLQKFLSGDSKEIEDELQDIYLQMK